MAKPHLYPDIPGLANTTQLYTQRRTALSQPTNYKFTVLDLANFLTLEYGFGPTVTIAPNQINYTPQPTGNTENLSQFVTDPENALWFIDINGLAISFEGLGTIYWSENVENSGIHEARHLVYWTPDTGANAADAVIQPKGTGAFALTSSGNKRGQYAIDLQLQRNNANEVASGPYSAILGGTRNRATGTLSGAGGHQAKALHNGSWVFADNTDAPFESTQEKELRLRFTNRINLRTAVLQVTDGDIKIDNNDFGIVMPDANGVLWRFRANTEGEMFSVPI